MADIKERLEQEKIKLEIFKHNLLCFKNDFHVKENFFVEKGKVGNRKYYNISQNVSSFSFLLSTFQYPNAKTCFFVELFNFYQDLPKRNDYPYRSFSQGFVTYCLKELARNQIIELVSCKKSHKTQLTTYMEMLGNYEHKNKEVQMYYSYFYKKRSFNKKDISLIRSMAHILNINASQLKIVSKDNKIYLKMSNKYKFHQLLTGDNFKNTYIQREVIYSILKEYKDYFFDDKKENSKQLSK